MNDDNQTLQAISLLKGLRVFLHNQRIAQQTKILAGNPFARPIKDLQLDQAMNFDPWFK